MTEELSVVAVQLASELGKNNTNLGALSELLGLLEPSSHIPRIVCLPELWNVGHFGSIMPVDDSFFELAENLEGPTLSATREMAASSGYAMIVPFFERTHRDEYYNSAAILDGQGEILGVYRKIHLSHSRNGCEKYYMRPGDQLPTFDIFGWRIGLQICYDREFPEPSRALAMAGADIIFYPTSTSLSRLEMWRAVLQTRAYENQVYAVGVSAAGTDATNEYQLLGTSMMASPNGNVMAELGVDDISVLDHRFSREELRRARITRFLRRDRRPEAYGGFEHGAPC